MANIALSGDINPSAYIKISDEELKVIKTKLSLGIKPDQIIINAKVLDGSRTLGVEYGIALNGVDYCPIVKGNKIILEEVPRDSSF